MFPDAALALRTSSVLQRARAGVCRQTLAAVTDPSLTEVAYCSLTHQHGRHATPILTELWSYASLNTK